MNILVQHVLPVEPHVVSLHLRRVEQPTFYLICDVLQCAKLVCTHNMRLKMEVWRAHTLVFDTSANRSNAAQDAADWPHVAAELALAAHSPGIAARALWAHPQIQNCRQAEKHLDTEGFNNC